MYCIIPVDINKKKAIVYLLLMWEFPLFQKMHNYQLSESNHLRVSFSKSNI